MIRKVSDSQLQTELGGGYRPEVVEPAIQKLPFELLGDRQFETLAYMLMKKEIASGKHTDFDDVALMQGVGERGRDCVLYSGSEVRGLIQCKKLSTRLTRPALLREIVKFLIHACLDSSILPAPERFSYLVFAPGDFTGEAIDLLHSFPVQIDIEIGNGTVDRYVHDALEEFESFRPLLANPPTERIRDLVKRIRIVGFNGLDLSDRVNTEPEVLRSFFTVRTIVSIEEADSVLRKALDDHGLKLLTDKHLRDIKDRISDIPPEQRVSMGFVDLYGFSIDFFKALDPSALKELVAAISKVRTTLDGLLIAHIADEINKRIFREITIPLLRTMKVHPYSVQLAAPYLHTRLVAVTAAGVTPAALRSKFFPETVKTPEQVITDVSQRLLATSARILAGDYSEVIFATESDRELKLTLFKHTHEGLKDVEAAETRLKIDIPILRPILDQLEKDIKATISPTRTVMIGDSSFFDDKAKLARVAQSLRDITPDSQKNQPSK